MLYDRLKGKVQGTSPYRGSKNRYPLGSRTHNTKNIFVREENGEIVYDLVYGFHHTWRTVSESEYKASPKVYQERDNYDYDEKGQWNATGKSWGYYEKTPRVIGTVRPDNTFEFVTTWLGQSEVMFMQRDIPTIECLVHSDSRKGGGVIKDRWRNPSIVIPAFQGLRIDLNTLKIHESQDVRIIKNNIDRKKSKPLMEKYGTMIKTSKAMFLAMDKDSFLREVLDLIKPYTKLPTDYRQLAVKAQEEGNHFDCAVFLSYMMNAGNLRHTVQWHGNGWSRDDWTPTSVHDALIRGLSKEIYRAESPFKTAEFKAGEDYGTTDWGIEVFCNGEKVKQY